MLPTIDEATAQPAQPFQATQPAPPTDACCSCRCDRTVQVNMNCYWCQFEDHLDQCFAKIGQ